MNETLEVKVGRMEERMDSMQRQITEFKDSQQKANGEIFRKFDDLAQRLDKFSLETKGSIDAQSTDAERRYATKQDVTKSNLVTAVLASAFSALVTYVLTHK